VTPAPDHVLVVIMAAMLVLGFDGLCLLNLAWAREVRFLPKWVWAVITLASFPLGGILYLTIGRDWGRDWNG
jgi:ABC-2 type transport system ATP-binding protein